MDEYYLPLLNGKFEITNKEEIERRLLSTIDTEEKRQFLIDLLLKRFDEEHASALRQTLLAIDSAYWTRFIDNPIISDASKFLRIFPDSCLDSCVCDPPAGIAFMGKKWDKDKGGREQWIAWMQGIATEVLRVLKPGTHTLVWALPRTSHWTATAWENAGFELRDIITYLFGSGFPKNRDISKALDKEAGVKRRIIGQKWKDKYPNGPGGTGFHGGPGEYTQIGRKPEYETEPATEAAKKWDGFGTALKPAAENWILLRKPISEKTIAANVLEWGCGALNIDGCKIPPQGESDIAAYTQNCSGDRGHEDNRSRDLDFKMGCGHASKEGRWPANLILDEEAGALLDKQSGILTSGKPGIKRGGNTGAAYGAESRKPGTMTKGIGDSGGASRFFYCAKPSKKEKNAGCENLEKGNNHPTVKSLSLMSYLCRLITPPGGIILDPFTGSGTTGVAAIQEGFKFIGCDMEPEHIEIARARIKHWAEKK